MVTRQERQQEHGAARHTDMDTGATAVAPDRPARRLPGVGLLGGVVSSLCCLPPAIAFALGASGSTMAVVVGLGRYRPFFVVAGLVIAALATWWVVRRSRRCCSPAEYRRNRVLVPVLTFGSFIATYALINLVLLPWLYTLR